MCSRYLDSTQGSAARNTRLSNGGWGVGGGCLLGPFPCTPTGLLYIVAQPGYNDISFRLTPNVNTKVYNVKIVQRYESNVPRIKVARTKKNKGLTLTTMMCTYFTFYVEFSLIHHYQEEVGINA